MNTKNKLKFVKESEPANGKPMLGAVQFRHASLFSGIGGFDLAAEWMGWENVFQVENNKWCLNNLAKNFPKTIRFNDIKDFDATQFKNKITILTGGFPCQPFSVAGLGKGQNDERYLWGEMFRVISETMPPYVVAENVSGLLTNQNGLAFEQVHVDLESKGYQTITLDIPASAKNAAHKRNRLFFVAYHPKQVKRTHNAQQAERQIQQFRNDFEPCDFANSNSTSAKHKVQTGGNEFAGILSTASNARCFNGDKVELQHRETKRTEYRSIEQTWATHWSEWGVKPTICRSNDGLPNKLDKHRVERIKALGNAVVPQVVYEIFKSIEAAHLHCA
jgi:DNA (cytosine-5)-methyltransferase 1